MRANTKTLVDPIAKPLRKWLDAEEAAVCAAPVLLLGQRRNEIQVAGRAVRCQQ